MERSLERRLRAMERFYGCDIVGIEQTALAHEEICVGRLMIAIGRNTTGSDDLRHVPTLLQLASGEWYATSGQVCGDGATPIEAVLAFCEQLVGRESPLEVSLRLVEAPARDDDGGE